MMRVISPVFRIRQARAEDLYRPDFQARHKFKNRLIATGCPNIAPFWCLKAGMAFSHEREKK
jgi:hypothetical protein